MKAPSRRRKWVTLAVAMVAGVALAWRPARAHVEAAELLQRFAESKGAAGSGAGEETLDVAPVRAGEAPIKARLYVPPGGENGSGIVLVHGVHRLGIDEPRLVRFARAVAASGVTVLTPEIRELADYHVDAASTDAIGAAARALRARTGHPVGLMGMSFAGGLALLAAADPRFAEDIAFVVAIGAHDDLARVSRFFATNAIARPDGAIVTMHAHEYGPLVLVYDRIEDFFPPEDVAAVRESLRLWLWEDRVHARERLDAMPAASPSRAKLAALYDGKLDAIGPQLLAEIDARAAVMSAASPHGHLAGLRAPVYLLHGAGDSVIPPSETLWLATDVPRGLVHQALVSPAIVHVEMEGEPTLGDKWALVHFMAEVLEAAGR